jgi:ferredoxin--NADP+ reductase
MDESSQLHRLTIAVVGSGPSGCYTAQFLRKTWPLSEVVVFEALPTPYGLIRYGVAPDHQGTKGVTRQFDRLFERDGARFAGNVRIGTDVPFDELADTFDVVVLATGLWGDRSLGVPQDPQARTIGAGLLLRGLNGYPGLAESPGLRERLGSHVAIVGNGNVAIDALRLLAKNREDLGGSDVDDRLLDILRPAPIEHIDIIGRSKASNAKFDVTALRELGQLSNVRFEIGDALGGEPGQVIDVLRDLAGRPASDQAGAHQVKVTFHFGQAPTAVRYAAGKTLLDTTSPTGESPAKQFDVDSVVTAIGFTGSHDGVPADWAAPNVWRVGWLRRGARGTIPENRRDAKDISDSVDEALRSGRIAMGKPGLSAIWPQVAGYVVEFGDWRRLDEHERQVALAGRCRAKVTDLAQMLDVAFGAHRDLQLT